jgi:hypothetical protein
MRYRIAALLLGIAVLATACTSANGTPATAPSVPVTVATTTTTESPVVTTTVTLATTTTLDRLSEIQAIYEALERRRLQAIYDQDEEAYRALFANQGYMERSLEVLSLLEFLRPPGVVIQEAVEILADTEGCIAALIRSDNTGLFVGGGIGESIHVIETLANGGWGLSYVGTGWTCDGPHPFS